MKSYDVELDTELGRKHGTMEITVENGAVGGVLNIMRHSEPFFGHMDMNGLCILRGKIITLISEAEYSARGSINNDGIELNMQIDKTDYIMRGKPSKRGGAL